MVYNAGKKGIFDGSIDMIADTIKIALVTDAYVPDIDAHAFFSDITNEVVGTGYVAGGKVLANKAVNQNNTGDRADFNADDVTWAGASFTARRCIIYKDTGVPGTSPLIAEIDFGENKTASGGDFLVQWAPAGLIFLGQ